MRAALPVAARRRLAATVADHLARSLLLRPGRKVAVYLAARGELDLAPIIEIALRRGCRLYLPHITSRRLSRMEFVRFDPRRELIRNHYGIAEAAGPRIHPRHLDLVFAPLVAFDPRGWRIGMGKGFYDRRLHFLRAGMSWRRPRLIGVAYEFQRVSALSPMPWDVPLDAILTEQGLFRTHRSVTQDNP